uniref:Uncharacterized protein n=1 Tax=Anguilla anguilla TaxID=7936 RepID=A0A0E9QT80_ANGAN
MKYEVHVIHSIWGVNGVTSDMDKCILLYILCIRVQCFSSLQFTSHRRKRYM